MCERFTVHQNVKIINKGTVDGAVMTNRSQTSSSILHQHIDKNCNIDGINELFESLVTKNMRVFRNFLNAGFDVNKRTIFEETPLHWAAHHSPVEMIRELILKGADINAQDDLDQTALIKATFNDDPTSLCTLLYYDADVHISCATNKNPLMWAITNAAVEASQILFHFYCDFSQKTIAEESILYLAAVAKNPLAVDLVKMSKTENEKYDSLLNYALKYDQAELFKLLWAKCKHIISIDAVLIKDYLSFCKFPNPDWLECLRLLFSSPVVSNHLKECQCNNIFGLEKKRVMWNVLLSAHSRKLDLDQRLSLIYLCLGYGVRIDSKSLNYVHLIYGFRDELEAFLFCSYYQGVIKQKHLLPLPKIIYFLDDCFDVDTVSPIFDYLLKIDGLRQLSKSTKNRMIMNSIGFNTLSFLQKVSIRRLCEKYIRGTQNNDIFNRLEKIPEMPSLIELSRNKARQFIKQTYNIKIAHEFYDILRLLNLPSRINDVLSFKVPIY